MTNKTNTVKSLFGLNSESVLNVRTDLEPWAQAYVPKINESFKFTNMVFNDLREFDLSGHQDGGLYIHGERGCGKSSTVEQFYARFATPVFRIAGHEGIEPSDLIGSWNIVNGDTIFQDGLLTLAARCGGVFLMDEVDACRPEILISLHMIFECGEKLIISETGEVVPVHPKFRIVVTGNTSGNGDSSGAYVGTNALNSATLDRFNLLEWGYLSPEVEKEIIQEAVPRLPQEVVSKLVEVANASRNGCEAISTRSLKRWARKVVSFQKLPLKIAFDRAIGFRLQSEHREELYALCSAHFGHQAFYGKEDQN